MINVIVCGLGKMGKAVAGLVAKRPSMDIFGVIEERDSPLIGQDAFALIGGNPDHGEVCIVPGWNSLWLSMYPSVATSFATPEATLEHAKMCYDRNIALVAGTTGLSADQLAELKGYAKTIPIVYDSNFSVGINVMDKVLFMLARLLPNWDVEIVEKHHNQKKDAPSGTAIRLANTVARAKGENLPDKGFARVYSRQGKDCKRQSEQISLLAVRAGDIIGEHEITIAGDGQRIEFNHRAHSRDNFASGVVKAIGWIIGQPAGLYNMQDVLGLR